MTLYELTAEYQELLNLAQDPDIGEDILQDTMEGLEGEIEIKADGYAKVMKELDGNIQAVKAEIERLTNMKKVLENNKERLKDSLESAMKATGKTKFKTDLFSFNIQKNPPSVQIDDCAIIPSTYLIEQEPKIDKKAIIADLKNGVEINGCALVQTEGLRIK